MPIRTEILHLFKYLVSLTKKACDSGWIHFAHLIGQSEGAKILSVRIEKTLFRSYKIIYLSRIKHYNQCTIKNINSYSWLLGFYDSTRDKDDTTVEVGHSRRYCNTGYDQSQGRRPSTLKCIGPISKGDIEPNHPSEINPNSDSRSRSDGRSRLFVQYSYRGFPYTSPY